MQKIKTALQANITIAGSLALLAFSSCANNKSSHTTSPAQTTANAKVKPYPLDTCMVMDTKLSSTPKTYTRIYKGQEVKFCCTSCIKAFESTPETFLSKIQ